MTNILFLWALIELFCIPQTSHCLFQEVRVLFYSGKEQYPTHCCRFVLMKMYFSATWSVEAFFWDTRNTSAPQSVLPRKHWPRKSAKFLYLLNQLTSQLTNQPTNQQAHVQVHKQQILVADGKTEKVCFPL